MSAHTPGEWEAEHHRSEPLPDPGYWVIIGLVMPDTLGAVGDTLNRHHCITPEEDEANARLFAAAPKLLAVVRKCEAMLTRQKWRADGDDPEAVLLREARAVIAQAVPA